MIGEGLRFLGALMIGMTIGASLDWIVDVWREFRRSC